MNKKGPHHPDVASLFRTLEELRSETPQANKDLPARLEKLLGQFPHFAGHFLYVFNYSLGRVVYARGFKEVLGYIDAKVDTGLLYGYREEPLAQA